MALPVIAPMTLADIDTVMAIEHVAFAQPWTRHMYVMDLTQNQLATYLVARPPVGGADGLPPVLAYGGSWLMVDETHIATLATHPDWRQCGLALAVLLGLIEKAMADGARRSTLEVRVSNLPAQQLYTRLGYQIVARRRRYYQDGEDAFIMTTPLLHEAEMQERMAAGHAAAEARMRTCFDGGSAPGAR